MKVAYLILVEGKSEHLPVGRYSIAIQKTWIQGGNIKFEGTVLDSLSEQIVERKEVDGNGESER
jgi:hypothetical protein